jgi:tetratricopeptide (TPR) repeat protein
MSFHQYVPAIAGLARTEAAQGHLRSAIDNYRVAVSRLPLPEYITGLGETELAAGQRQQADQDLALISAEERLLQANGVNTDVDLALFEANHGSPARAVILARRAWAQAPSVRSADALGWAYTRAGHPAQGLHWAHEAVKLGSVDPNFLYHAGIAAKQSGHAGEAHDYISRALALNPNFSPLYAPLAKEALR